MASRVVLARHGQTAWSLAGKHTGRTDLPLTPVGETEARDLGDRLRQSRFAVVLTSPLTRAKRTCELAGFGAAAQTEPDLMEWNYGAYEGLTSAEIHRERPDWRLFRDGCPSGEHLEAVVARADRVLERLRGAGGDALVFSHGHFIRVLGVRWARIDPVFGTSFALASGALSVLGFDHGTGDPVIEHWNDVGHLG